MLCLQAHDVQRLLKDACNLAVQAPAEERANWACVREEMFPASDQNQYRHLRVADFSDNVSALPPEELQVQLILQLVSRGLWNDRRHRPDKRRLRLFTV